MVCLFDESVDAPLAVSQDNHVCPAEVVLMVVEMVKLSVPAPKFHTWNVWAVALFPMMHEEVSEVGENAIVGGMTVRFTGMDTGLMDESVGVMVIVAE
jgi:hypothetical protein